MINRNRNHNHNHYSDQYRETKGFSEDREEFPEDTEWFDETPEDYSDYTANADEMPVQAVKYGSTTPGGSRGKSRRRRRSRGGSIVRWIAIAVAALFLVAAVWFGLQWKKAGDPAAAAADKEQPGYYTVAVFGVDSRSGTVGKEALSDVNIIARIDMKTGEIRLVSLFRDTYAQISEDGRFHKLNEAYFRGGPDAAVKAVEMNTDVGIDDYAAFNWKAIVDAINILGGIDLEITDAEFKYINAFITETVNVTGVGSYQLEHAGMNHLDGVQAVAYARLRLMDTDFNRTERQRKVVRLAFDKAKEADFLTLNNILVTVMPQISTSVGMADMIPFARNIHYFHLGEAGGFPFDRALHNVGKLDCVVPVTLESNVRALHAFLYPEEPYEPSKRLLAISDKIIVETGLGGSGETAVRTDKVDGGTGNAGGSGNGSGGSNSGGGNGTADSASGNADGGNATADGGDGNAAANADAGTDAADSGDGNSDAGTGSAPDGNKVATPSQLGGIMEIFDDIPLPFKR